jgi:hypothetical protein
MSTEAPTRPAKLMCEHCGSPFLVDRVAVIEKGSARLTTLKLCERCRKGDGRTWRNRYELADGHGPR